MVPSVHQCEVLSSAPAGDSLNLLVGFVRSCLLLETQLRTSLSWSGFEERASRRSSAPASKKRCAKLLPLRQLQRVQSCNCLRRDTAKKKKKKGKTFP